MRAGLLTGTAATWVAATLRRVHWFCLLPVDKNVQVAVSLGTMVFQKLVLRTIAGRLFGGGKQTIEDESSLQIGLLLFEYGFALVERCILYQVGLCTNCDVWKTVSSVVPGIVLFSLDDRRD